MSSSAGMMSERPLPEALGESEAFLDFQQRLSRVAQVDRPVLIVGERGTGKELVAGRLHYLSKRWQAPLVTLNCAALSPGLLESELFGHEAGAFTGATQRKRGRFETAASGTLFLDEIGLIPMEVQEKILRVVEYSRFERVGSSDPVEVDVRIIGATNADLPALAAAGKFKQDLLDRLSFEVLVVPPLRERGGDIMLLARHFAARMAHELGRDEAPAFSDGAMAMLEAHQWLGNVRELKNVVERAVYRCDGETIESIDFDPFRTGGGTNPHRIADVECAVESVGQAVNFSKSLPQAVRDLEVRWIGEALKRSKYHQGEAARLLGVSYYQFRAYYRKYKAILHSAL